MEQNGSPLRAMVVLTCLIAASGPRELRVRSKAHKAVYNHTLATILVEYALAGFEVIELIVDIQHCLQPYVGMARDRNAVVIAFRGTQEHSIQNWVEDLYWTQLGINYPCMPGAMVHHGFYFAHHNATIRPCILDAVIRAKDLYGDINVMVTGHSMGGAMASSCALDLLVWLYNIGFGSLVYQVEKVCDSSGEDPSCSRSVTGNSIADHLIYYGMGLMADMGIVQNLHGRTIEGIRR